jgi:hypothetical protein
MDTVIVFTILGLAAAFLVARLFAKKRSPTCGADCVGCDRSGKPQPLVTLRR